MPNLREILRASSCEASISARRLTSGARRLMASTPFGLLRFRLVAWKELEGRAAARSGSHQKLSSRGRRAWAPEDVPADAGGLIIEAECNGGATETGHRGPLSRLRKYFFERIAVEAISGAPDPCN
jgi:hypothetical protein